METHTQQADAGRLRVLYLSWRDRDNPEAGGAEVFTERTAEVLTHMGHSVTLFTSRFPGSSRAERHGEVRVVRSGNRFTCYLRGLLHVWRSRDEYDVIIDVQNGVPFWSPLAARVPVVNVVHHVHREQWRSIFGPVVARFGWFLESRLAPFVYRRCRYVTVSEATRRELDHLGIDAARTDVVYSGNDLPDDYASYANVPKTTTPSLIVLGRLVPHKNVETAVDLLARLAPEHPHMELHVVGDGYWHDEIVAHAERTGVADRLHMHGFVDERTKHTLLAQSWVVVMPSHKEGWGLTIVEGGLHGTPAVAYAHAGGPSESVRHGDTGLLAADTDELTRHVTDLIADDQLRIRLGENAKRHARSFDWSASGQELALSLHRAMGSSPALLPARPPAAREPVADMDVERAAS